ncbi:hypothetical protein KYK30_07880 [Shinella yambaruensis]|uniref:Uncharacterized protein n=1 Tax=Shinella yambaruensis TaxID=415996 RepID=A0ABQ5ZPU8_9HYPH|nr:MULTISPECIES: hypothetical protein [Shinella]MCJ8025654.1 hypothetical protein [Shinella yambaruensis]MCU7979606.1 hypothetical protein [Shinella yambaruensis]MCW5711679.1 hypothetical protein [Shinella sp.]GLR53066.1 hypothetical protein GCM10007923_42810 [Shinella yambaruensis]
MKHHATDTFWTCYAALPSHIREQADRNFALLKANPAHPSLQLKPVGRFWSARVGLSWRALAVRDAETDTLVWFWIGSHADYDRLVGRKR